MPGPVTGPRPGGWETLVCGIVGPKPNKWPIPMAGSRPLYWEMKEITNVLWHLNVAWVGYTGRQAYSFVFLFIPWANPTHSLVAGKPFVSCWGSLLPSYHHTLLQRHYAVLANRAHHCIRHDYVETSKQFVYQGRLRTPTWWEGKKLIIIWPWARVEWSYVV